MTKELKEKIRKAASIEDRNMANFCVHYLTKAVQMIEKQGESRKGLATVPNETASEKSA